MKKKIILIILLLIPLAVLFATDSTTFAFVKSLRYKPLTPYVKIFNWAGDGGVLLICCFLFYAWGHAYQWDLKTRTQALKDVIRAPMTKKGKPWGVFINEILGKLYLFFQNQAERAAFQGALALAMAGIITRILKFFIGRPRPSAAAEGIVHWGPSLLRHYDSFPSGHSTSSFAFAAAISFYYPYLRIPLFAIALLVALARVYLGHHYFADVYGGALVGLLGGLLARQLVEAMEKRASTAENPD